MTMKNESFRRRCYYRIWKRVLFILGAPDPEMEEIERVVRFVGAGVVYATVDGTRVHAGNAYGGGLDEFVRSSSGPGEEGTWEDGDSSYWREIVAVECASSTPRETLRIDHHRSGDPGFGRPSSEFLVASSLGQVLDLLDLAPTAEQRLIAAADHCLGAAYRGMCPGVDPEALGMFRAEARAKFQKRSVAEVLADIAVTETALADEPLLKLREGIVAVDMRRGHPWPELPEAACRAGVSYVSGPLICPDGRKKITCSGHASQIEAFMGFWAPKNGLVDIYGDPTRGFAGGYESSHSCQEPDQVRMLPVSMRTK